MEKRKEKKSDTPILDWFGGVVICLQALFSLFVFFASFFISDHDLLDKTGFNEANKSIKALNKEIENLKRIDFVMLTENLQRFQQLKTDTLHTIDKSDLYSLEKVFVKANSRFKTQFEILNQKVDKLQKEIKLNSLPNNYATSGWQVGQTIILIIIGIGIFILIVFEYKRNGYS